MLESLHELERGAYLAPDVKLVLEGRGAGFDDEAPFALGGEGSRIGDDRGQRVECGLILVARGQSGVSEAGAGAGDQCGVEPALLESGA